MGINSGAPAMIKNTFYMAMSIFLLLLSATHSTVSAGDGTGPAYGMKSLDNRGRMQISSSDRCPVCGMKVIRYPKFSCAIQLQDTSTYYFCSTGCMVRSWMHPEIYLGKQPTDLKQPVVREYFSGRQVDARRVIFVHGSDVIGPMGPALVPVLDGKNRTVFMKRHGGKTVLRLESLTDAEWLKITGRKMLK
jgi:copper chaperone NosL